MNQKTNKRSNKGSIINTRMNQKTNKRSNKGSIINTRMNQKTNVRSNKGSIINTRMNQKTNVRSNKDSIKNTRMNPCALFEILDALYQQYLIPLCSGMTNKYNIVGTVPKQNQTVVETEAKSIPLTHI
jgi:ATP-dependent 26S proteasome regulatory subunit